MTAEHPRTVAAATARVLRERVETGDLWVEVTGDSMRPTLRPPAKVLVAAAADPRWGEVWAFVDDRGSIVVHRYLRRRRDTSLVFRGDGLDREDWAVLPHQLVGRVAWARDTQGAHAVTRRYLPVVRSFGSAARRRARRLVGRRRG